MRAGGMMGMNRGGSAGGARNNRMLRVSSMAVAAESGGVTSGLRGGLGLQDGGGDGLDDGVHGDEAGAGAA